MMKQNILFWIFLITGWGIPLLQAENETAWERGNAAFATGRYAEAVKEYESLSSHRPISAALFYNLANAYYREGKTGAAILNYERALWLDPRDPDIRANLRFVRSVAGLYSPETSLWREVIEKFSLNAWSWGTWICLAIFCGSLSIRTLKLDTRWSARPLIFTSFLTLILVSAAAVTRAGDLNRAVVVSPDAPLRVAPLESAPASFNLSAGSVIHVEKRRGSYLFIHAEKGHSGWISEKHASRVVPGE